MKPECDFLKDFLKELGLLTNPDKGKSAFARRRVPDAGVRPGSAHRSVGWHAVRMKPPEPYP